MESIRNRTAEEVYDRVEKLLAERTDVCRCATCVLDLVAFTLNRATPHYSVSLLADLHPDQGKARKLQVEIDLALQAGVKRLREHPHHEVEARTEDRKRAGGH